MDRVEAVEKHIKEDEEILAVLREDVKASNKAITQLEKDIKGNRTRLQKLKEKGEQVTI